MYRISGLNVMLFLLVFREFRYRSGTGIRPNFGNRFDFPDIRLDSGYRY
jgi:hypothetical protein